MLTRSQMVLLCLGLFLALALCGAWQAFAWGRTQLDTGALVCADTLRLLREHHAHAGVIHCFTEDTAFAKAALDLGFYISFSGIVSFKSAQALRDVAAYVPLERLLIETDSPYLAPVPYRGKTNQPAYVAKVAECLAQVRHMPLEALAEASSRNFDQLFFRT